MTLLLGLHGTVALILLGSLLLIEEAGVPLPIPGELTLIAAGLLIGTGALNPWLFVPVAIACCLTGALAGYSWARLVGEHGLRVAAEKIHQTKRLDQVTRRLRNAGAKEIALCRLIPFLRVNTTLVAGAVGVDRRRFLLGIAPVTVLWVGVYTVLGAIAGIRVEALLGQLEALILQGGILIVIGAGGYLAIRRAPERGRAIVGRLPARLRMALAAAVDLALIATLVSGVLGIVSGVIALLRPLLPVATVAGWVELAVIVAVLAIFYSVVTRRGRRPTAGETLFETRYLTHPADDPGLSGLRRTLRALIEQSSPTEPADLVHVATLLRALSGVRQLQVTRPLLDRERSLADLAVELQLPLIEVTDVVRNLRAVGVLVERTEGDQTRYAVANDDLKMGLTELLTQGGAPASPRVEPEAVTAQGVAS